MWALDQSRHQPICAAQIEMVKISACRIAISSPRNRVMMNQTRVREMVKDLKREEKAPRCKKMIGKTIVWTAVAQIRNRINSPAVYILSNRKQAKTPLKRLSMLKTSRI